MAPEPLNILALDLATTFGWAIGKSDQQKPRFGSERLGRRGDEPGEVGRLFLIWFSDITRIEKIDAVYIERAMAPAVAARIGTNADTNMILVGLAFMAASFAKARQVPIVRFVDAQDAKQNFTGQRRFKDEFDPSSGKILKSREVGKRATIARCHQIGIMVQEDNQADAVSLWFYGASKHNPRLSAAVTPLFAESGQ